MWELHARFPTYALVMTTFTVTGRDHARALFKDAVQVQFLPFDLRGSARRFCDRIRPQFVVFFETELWPNLYRECGRRQVPLVIANARLSPRSVRRYRKFHGIFERTLANARLIAAQSEADAERFRSLGATPAVVRTAGNIKFDFVLKPDVVERGARLRKIYAGAQPVWIAGSTHGGEEELILEAHRHVQVIHPNALLILVPRHPDRASQIDALLNRKGMQFVRRSEDVTCRATTQVLLVDTLGELLDFYAASDVAFVGGSLVPIGGHNLLEPAALGLPILTGPHHSNGAAVAQTLIERGGLEIVHSVSELASKVVQWLADSEERERIGGLARMAVQDNRGSLARLVDLIQPLLS